MNKLLLIIVLFFPFAIRAQTFSERLQQRLTSYYRDNLPLKIHLATNQPGYEQGDTIFFKIYLLSAQGLRPIAGRSIVTVMLTDSLNHPVVTEQISVREGSDFNQIIIPSRLPNGKYFLVAFNDWMKNSSEELYFRKAVSVGKVELSGSPIGELSVFPEGRWLVEGLTSRLVAQGTPRSSVNVLDQTNQKISEVQLNDHGYGIFMLTPSANSRYKLVATNGDEKVIPEALTDGAVMTVLPVQNKSVRTTIQLPSESKFRDENLHIVLSVQGQVAYAADFSFKNQKQVTVSIPIENVPPGIAQLTLFSDGGKVLSERMVYVPPLQVDARIELSQETFGTREKVAVEVSTLNGDRVPVKSRMTATVFRRAENSDEDSAGDILTSLYFRSDLGDSYPVTASAVTRQIDMSLMAAEWLRFSWDSLEKKDNVHNFNQNIRFTGKAVYEKSGLPVKDSTLISFFLQNTVVVYQVHTNDKGEFDMFMLFDFFGSDEVFYRAEYKGLFIDSVKVLAGNMMPSSSSSDPIETSKDARHSLDRRAIERSYSFYSGERSDYRKIVDRRTTFAQEYRQVDLSIRLSDYLLFPDMSETLREIVPLVKHRKSRGNDIIRIYNDELDNFPDENPVFVIDGIMTDDVRYFLSLNPKDVESISVIYTDKKIDMFGPIGKAGIIVVETKIPDNNLNVPRSRNTVTIPGLSRRLPYPFKTHGPSDARIPDLRTNLTWKPELISNDEGHAKLEFFTSDVPGEYVIVIEGITSDGDPFAVRRSFQVEFKPSAN